MHVLVCMYLACMDVGTWLVCTCAYTCSVVYAGAACCKVPLKELF
jgi:hypothetical protein